MGDYPGVSSVVFRREVGREIRAYVGALPLAATLLALVVSAGAGVTAGSAQATTLPAASALTAGFPSAVPQGIPGLFPGAGYEPGGSRLVRDVQRLLARTGYRPGPIDGRYGPLTEAAVRRFQADRGLEVDGIAGHQTLGALEAPALTVFPGAGYEPGGSRVVRDLQRLLARTGYRPGPIDGRYGPLTEAAVRRFQAHRGLQVDGIAGPRTFADLRPRTRSQPITLRTPRPAPVPAKAPRTTYRPALRTGRPAGSLPLGWPLLLAAVGFGLLLFGGWYARRVRTDRIAASAGVRGTGDQSAIDQAANGSPLRGEEDQSAIDQAANGSPLRGEGDQSAIDQTADGTPLRADARLKSLKEMNGSNGTGHPGDVSGEADEAFNLGVLLEEQHDLAGAEAAYRRADERGHAAAASNLGVLLEGQGDLVGAQTAYRRADERGEANGAFNLGVLLEEQHDYAGAESAYRRADERGHAAAAANLGVLLEAQGDPVSAEAAYRRADERGEANGAFNLGILLEEQGDLAGAEPAYKRADQLGQAKVAQLARAALLDLRSGNHYAGAARNGDRDGA